MRHVQQSAHEKVDLISIKGVCGSKPYVNLTSRLLGRHAHHYLLYRCGRTIRHSTVGEYTVTGVPPFCLRFY